MADAPWKHGGDLSRRLSLKADNAVVVGSKVVW